KAGLPIPSGFSLSTAAYRDFMTGLQAPIASILATADYTHAAQLDAQAQAIRALICRTPVPAGLAGELRVAYAALSAGAGSDSGALVAVRSSGTAEDLAEASFAGLHDTFLDVAGDDAVLDAVRRCWASLWNAHAIHYRHDQGYAHHEAQLAVIIQRMVAAETAGVMFTANPLNSRTDEFVVNASWGLGEGVVSGILTPDEFVIARGDLRVKARTLGSKEVPIVRNPAGIGTVRLAVPADQQEKFCLDDGQVTRLAELGRRVMEYYDGLPQDLEWAYAEGEFHLLQARRVTGVEFTWDEDINAGVPARHDDQTVWTSTWADDFLTGGVTPLYYSVRVGGEFQAVHDHTNKIYGFPELAGRLIFKYRRATAFFNCDIAKEWNVLSLPASLRNYDYVPYSWDGELRAAKFNLYKFARMLVRLHVLEPKTGVFHWLSDKPGGVYHYLRHRIAEADGPTPDELRKLSDEALQAQIKKTRALADEWVLTRWAGFNFWAVGALGSLGVALKQWHDGSNAAACQDLISGMPNTLMVPESRAQWHLADPLRRTPAVLALFREINGPAFFAAAAESAAGREFLERYRGFLREHGHRGHQDRDYYYARRCEDVAIDYRMLRAYLAGDESVTPAPTEQRLVANREAATAEVLTNIRRKRCGWLKAKLFARLLDYVTKFMIQRDDERHYYDRITFQTKKYSPNSGGACWTAACSTRRTIFSSWRSTNSTNCSKAAPRGPWWQRRSWRASGFSIAAIVVRNTPHPIWSAVRCWRSRRAVKRWRGNRWPVRDCVDSARPSGAPPASHASST
ncbi:MAG: hypothetical protein EXR83_12285, partial [Gammaproteobacteria bacterium]|nr:hypothetical protein [Gammaproteobacteria bacterium]